MADLKISALTAATTPLAGTEVLPIVQSGTTKKVAISDVTAGRSVSVGDLTLTTGGAITTASEAYDYRYSSGGVGNNARVRYRAVYSGGGSGYGGSFELESRTSGNVWNTGAFTVTDAGNISTTGNLVMGTSGKGIDFSATSGSGTSELLADYEEGTWTPALAFGGGSTGVTYTTQAGTYTKVGRTVTVRFEIELSNKGSSTGAATITGLPYSSAALTPVLVYMYSNFAGTYKTGIAYIGTNVVYEFATYGSATFTDTSFTNTSRFWAVATYQV